MVAVRYLILFVVLAVFWVMLSGQVDLANPGHLYLLGCGAGACVLALVLVRRVGFLGAEGPVFAIFFRQIPYLFWLAWQIVLSSRDVTRLVWSPKRTVDPRVFRTPFRMKSDLATTIYANSITLTPGTVTMQVDTTTREFVIHALSGEFEGGLPPMHDRVLALEGKPEAA